MNQRWFCNNSVLLLRKRSCFGVHRNLISFSCSASGNGVVSSFSSTRNIICIPSEREVLPFHVVLIIRLRSTSNYCRLLKNPSSTTFIQSTSTTSNEFFFAIAGIAVGVQRKIRSRENFLFRFLFEGRPRPASIISLESPSVILVLTPTATIIQSSNSHCSAL